MSLIKQPFGFGAGKATLEFTTSTYNASSLSTYTFSSQAIGTAAADRQIIVAICGFRSGTGDTVNSVTVGGEATVQAVIENAQTQVATAIHFGTLTTGTTADIVVNWSVAQTNGCSISLYKATGMDTSVDDSGSDKFGAETVLTTNLNIPTGGVAVAQVGENSNPLRSTSWGSDFTEDGDDVWNTYYSYYTASSDEAGAAVTSECTFSGSVNNGSMSVASWGPA